jgi:hypothetical protein
MLVPNALYQSAEAAQWLSQIELLEQEEEVLHYACKPTEAHYVFAHPTALSAMLHQHVGKVNIYPLAAHHFQKHHAAGDAFARITLTDGWAIATLWQKNSILWHQVFEYETVEDIVWQLASACRLYAISPAALSVQTDGWAHTDWQYRLATYLPGLQLVENALLPEEQQHWLPVLHLFQQLSKCAS